MTATTVLVTLLLAPATSGSAAAAAPCESFTRGTEPLPPLVREWFEGSGDQRVRMCPQPAAPGSTGTTALYFGEGALSQRGTVCTYLSHGLTLAGSGAAARLERYDRSDALAMALAHPDCPRPHAASAQGYVETYDVSPAAFLGIMHLWSTLAAAPAATASGSGEVRGTTPETRARLQAALGKRMSAATVTRIVRIPGSVLRHRYAVFVKEPAASGEGTSQYVIYVDKSLRGPYGVTAFAETN